MSQTLGESGTVEETTVTEYDAIVVGAGFAGLYMLHKLRELGFSAHAFEKGDGVGGTWYWNRYPGARCDSPSLFYSFSFDEALQQEWEWTERYPTQPEILRYLNHVADRFDLRKDISFETPVQQAHFNDEDALWHVRTADGRDFTAKYFITAAGCLTEVNKPKFRGLDSFEGDWYHTARWPETGVDFTGKRVGVIGTGSTGIQAIPQIAKAAGHLTVFQRTPNYSLPAHNHPLEPDHQREIKARFGELREKARHSPAGLYVDATPPSKSALEATEEERLAAYEEGWKAGLGGVLSAFTDVTTDLDANATAAEFVRTKIRETVQNPEFAEVLASQDYPIGTKRICIDTEYFETYNRDNVSLADIKANPIEEITPKGIRLADGTEHELDIIVFAIGFDAMTGALLAIDIRGEEGTPLKEAWAEGPKTYLGLQSVGFPNMFMITGPGSPSVLSNMPTSIEQHVEWIGHALEDLREQGLDTIEATREAQDAWVEHVNDVADQTLYKHANSWYLGANIPGKVRVFMPYVGGVGNYRAKCDEVRAKGYEGFALSASGSSSREPVGAAA
jgi:cyclohexanone monooxygenase